jgi:hypothetical protein
MKRLAAVAVMLVWLSSGAFAQRVGSQGGFSGSHGGFSAPAGGFAGRGAPMSHAGFAAPRGGYRSATPGFMGPAQFAPRSSPFPVRGPQVVDGMSMSMASSSINRAPFHAPNGGRRGRDGHFHNHVIVANRFRGFPFFGGYPFIWPSTFDDWGNWDNCSQQTGNRAEQQPSCNGSQYQPQPDQYEPQPDDQDDPPGLQAAAQPSSSSRRAPHDQAQAPFVPAGALVFKNGNVLEYKWVTPKIAHGSR